MTGYNISYKPYFWVKILFCIFCISISNVMIMKVAFAQQEKMDGQSDKFSADNDGRSLLMKVQRLLDDEKYKATSSLNVRKRFRNLTLIISEMLRSGSSAKEILPKDEGHAIGTLIRQGQLDDAAQRVRNAILKLEKLALKVQTNGDMPGSQKSLQPPSGAATDIHFSSDSLFRINIHHLSNKTSFDNILKLMNPCVDSANRRLYFTGTKSTFLGVVDLDKNELIETFDIGIPGGFLIRDPQTSDIYLFDIGMNMFFKIDVMNREVSQVDSLPPYLSMPVKGAPKFYKGYSYKDTGYPFKVGYLQNENAAYGVIEINDSSRNKVGQIKYGPNALYSAIDQKTGKLYTTNSGDGSISIFDLHDQRRKIKDIDVGTSVDEIVLNNNKRRLYIRNRLGGSTIFHYDMDSKTLATIPNENTDGVRGIGMWPTQIIYDDNKLYVLSHYGSRIDVIDISTDEVIGRIELNLSYKPRTDGISTMVMDRHRKILYSAFPELGELAVADAKTLKHVKTIQIKGFEMGTIGPAQIVIAVDDKLNKLFVYLPNIEMLYVYDLNTYILERKIPINVGRTKQIIMSNAEKGVLYLGNKTLDAKTLKVMGTFEIGRKVIGFDNSTDRIYLTGMMSIGRGKKVEKVYEYVGLTLNKEWTLSPILSIPSSFDFDFNNNRFYVGYFESAAVEVFDLTAGQESTSDRYPPTPRREERLKGGPIPSSSKSRRCGDGICQPIEKETGRCPEDCK